MGALYRKMDSKAAILPNTESQRKDKDKFNKRTKQENLISLSLKALLNTSSRQSMIFRVECYLHYSLSGIVYKPTRLITTLTSCEPTSQLGVILTHLSI